MTEKDKHYCYILYNECNNTTYNGYTNNLTRRLRQHNRELVGGAKATRKNAGTWKYLAIITCDTFTKNKSLSYEYRLRYPTNKKPRPSEYNGPDGRILSIPLVLINPKFINMNFEISVLAEYLDILQNICVCGGLDNVIFKELYQKLDQ
jgi:predicted GIY-YIG superfamily endonuclease